MKYGLHNPYPVWLYYANIHGRYLYSSEEISAYMNLVDLCHDAVSAYLDEHPDIVFGSKHNMYYDILKLANPALDAWVSSWCVNYWNRKDINI